MNQRYESLAVRPDDKSGIRGVEPTGATPDLSEVQRQVAADQVASTSVSSRPDDKAGVRGPGVVQTQPAELATVTSNGFDWNDAGIGAGTALGIMLVLMGGLALTKRRHSELAV